MLQNALSNESIKTSRWLCYFPCYEIVGADLSLGVS